MSEPHQLPAATQQPDEPIVVDPLLESGSFIDAEQDDVVEVAGGEKPNEETPNAEFPPGAVIAAQPISMVRPGEFTPEVAPPSVRRRDPEEMGKRPSWLPEDWTIELKVRTSGATVGLIDRYYVDPVHKRRFRSKVEVLHFVETGCKLKRKANEADSQASASPRSRKQKKSSEASASPAGRKARKSSGKGKKAEEVNADDVLQPMPLNSVPMDLPQQENDEQV